MSDKPTVRISVESLEVLLMAAKNLRLQPPGQGGAFEGFNAALRAAIAEGLALVQAEEPRGGSGPG